MKKVFLIFVLFAISACAGIENNKLSKFDGEWLMNDANSHFGGVIKISKCSDKKCHFELQSWYDLHICDVKGEMVFTGEYTAEYTTNGYEYDRNTGKEKFPKIGIIFNILPDGTISSDYSNLNSRSSFCGMMATVKGIWKKKPEF